MGSLTNWDARDVKVPLDFLGDGKYVAEIYADAPDAAEEATHTVISRQTVDRRHGVWTCTWSPAAATRCGFIRRIWARQTDPHQSFLHEFSGLHRESRALLRLI